jgi:hypothetical protein
LCADFEGLSKSYDKARKVVDREGIPRFYLRCLVELMDFVNEVSCLYVIQGLYAGVKAKSLSMVLLITPRKLYEYEEISLCGGLLSIQAR